MTFRFQARHAALTYPQATCTKDALFSFLTSITGVVKALVAEETHADGGIHYHCYLGFRASPRICIRDPNHFDFQLNHPNIQAVRNVKDWIKYCTKEDLNPLANFSYTPDEVFKTILLECEKGLHPTQVFRNAVTADPKLIKNGSSIIASIQYLSTKSVAPSEPRFNYSTFVLPFEFSLHMEAWRSRILSMPRGDRTFLKSLWFVGPSMTGKTSLARSLGTHWYMASNWNLKKICDNDNIYGVVDDLTWDSLRFNYKGLLGRQTDVTFTDKYCRKTEFKFGFPVIVCTNTLPPFTPEERDWLKFNVSFWKFDSSVTPGCNHPAVTNLFL